MRGMQVDTRLSACAEAVRGEASAKTTALLEVTSVATRVKLCCSTKVYATWLYGALQNASTDTDTSWAPGPRTRALSSRKASPSKGLGCPPATSPPPPTVRAAHATCLCPLLCRCQAALDTRVTPPGLPLLHEQAHPLRSAPTMSRRGQSQSWAVLGRQESM